MIDDYTSSDGSTFTILNGGAADGDALEAYIKL